MFRLVRALAALAAAVWAASAWTTGHGMMMVAAALWLALAVALAIALRRAAGRVAPPAVAATPEPVEPPRPAPPLTAAEERIKTDALLDGLANAARRIGDVLRQISDLSAQANFTVLDDTVAAAQASAGHAAAAGTVRQLALRSARAAEQMSARMDEIQTIGEGAVSALRGIESTFGFSLGGPSLGEPVGIEPLRTGNTLMDNGHRLVFGDLDRLRWAAAAGHDAPAIAALVDRVIASTRACFGREQLLMQLEGWPAIQAHQAAHDEFLARLMALKGGASPRAIDDLRDRLASHIVEADRPVAAHLAAEPER